MKNYLSKEQTLLAPKNTDKKLVSLLDHALSNYTISKKVENVPDIMWGEERYKLERSSFFRDLKTPSKENVYSHLTKCNLALSWYIERSGHNYGAKMILMSETQDEKSLYSLFVAEEAIHQREFENFIDFDPDPNIYWHPMLDPLALAIKEGEKQTCLYVIQVLLEGFGIGLYSSLRDGCNFEPLKQVYTRIINDEAKHHGSGVIQTQDLTPKQLIKDQVFEYTRIFIKSLTSADMLATTVSREKELSSQEKKKFYEEVNYSALMTQRLLSLKSMLSKVDKWGLVKRLEKEKSFIFS